MGVANLTVRFNDDSGIQYLENEILGDGLTTMTPYQYRFPKKDK